MPRMGILKRALGGGHLVGFSHFGEGIGVMLTRGWSVDLHDVLKVRMDVWGLVLKSREQVRPDGEAPVPQQLL